MDIHNLETRLAILTQRICKSCTSAVRSRKVSTGAAGSLPTLLPKVLGLGLGRSCSGALGRMVFSMGLRL